MAARKKNTTAQVEDDRHKEATGVTRLEAGMQATYKGKAAS